jgi:hypothetical protein
MPIELKPLNIKAQQKKAGYRPRILCNVEGIQKHGKSHFSLTAPKWLWYMNFDKISDEDILPKFDGQNIVVSQYWPEDLTKEAGQVVWDKFLADWKEAKSNPDIRTIVVDTFTEVRNVCLQKSFGKVAQLGNSFMYGGPHQELRQLINEVYTTNKNLILVHKEKKLYTDGNWKGDYELQGFADTPFLVQTNLRLSRTQDKDGRWHFNCTVLDCSIGQGPDLIGAELSDEACNFPTLATLIFPDTSIEDWQ